MGNYIAVNYEMLPYWVIIAFISLTVLGVSIGLSIECEEKYNEN